MNKTHDVIEILKRRMLENPDSRLFVSIAEEYRKRDNHEMAIDTLLEGLRHHPQYSHARMLLVNLYLDNQMTNEAYNECKKILSYEPNHINALRTCARISALRGEDESARGYYTKVLEIKPDDKEAMDFVSRLSVQVSKVEEDLATKEKKVEDDDPIEDYIRQAELLINNERYKEAISIYNHILSRSPHAKDILQKREELNSLFQMYASKRHKAIKRLKDLKGIFLRSHFKAS